MCSVSLSLACRRRSVALARRLEAASALSSDAPGRRPLEQVRQRQGVIHDDQVKTQQNIRRQMAAAKAAAERELYDDKRSGGPGQRLLAQPERPVPGSAPSGGAVSRSLDRSSPNPSATTTGATPPASARDRLLQEQQSAYEASVDRDRRRQEQERRRQALKREQEREIARCRLLLGRWRDEIPDEPAPGSANCAAVQFRLPGARAPVRRRFRATDKLSVVRRFAAVLLADGPDVSGEPPATEVHLVTSFPPRRTLTADHDQENLEALHLTPSCSLFVEVPQQHEIKKNV